VAIASSKVIPSFLSGEYFGSEMSSNLFSGATGGEGRSGSRIFEPPCAFVFRPGAALGRASERRDREGTTNGEDIVGVS